MRWEYQTTLPPPEKFVCRTRSNRIGYGRREWFKIGKGVCQSVYCHPAYLIYMQSTSGKMLGWMKHELESRFPWEYQWPQICRWHHFNGRKLRGSNLDEDERRESKSWLKTQHSKNKDHGIWSYHFTVSWWGKCSNNGKFYFLGLQNQFRQRLQSWD